MVLQDDIDDPAYDSALRSYSFGDLDNDGIEELIFSTGSGSTAEDNMAVVSLASLGDSTPGVVVNVNPSQITGFKSIGWDITTTVVERAVFVLHLHSEIGGTVPYQRPEIVSIALGAEADGLFTNPDHDIEVGLRTFWAY